MVPCYSYSYPVIWKWSFEKIVKSRLSKNIMMLKSRKTKLFYEHYFTREKRDSGSYESKFLVILIAKLLIQWVTAKSNIDGNRQHFWNWLTSIIAIGNTFDQKLVCCVLLSPTVGKKGIFRLGVARSRLT